MVSVFFFFSFISLQLLVLKPPALRQFSQREREGGRGREKEGERIEGMVRCLSKQPFSHPEGLCPTLAQEGEVPHVMTTLYLSARPQMAKGSWAHLRSADQSDLDEMSFPGLSGCLGGNR